MPCAIAGVVKLPAAEIAAVAPSSTSRRRRFIPFSLVRTIPPQDCLAANFKALSARKLQGPYALANRPTSSRSLGTRLLLAFFGISAFSALVAAAALYAFFEVGRSLSLIDRRIDPILASLEVSRSVERIVSASSALSSVTTEAQRDQVFAGLSGEASKLQSFFSDLRDGGHQEQRTRPDRE